MLKIRTTLALGALGLALAACGETTRPGTVVKPKDAGIPDLGFINIPDLGVPDLGINLCACDTTPNVCNTGCACDTACVVTNPDGGVVTTPDTGTTSNPDSGQVTPPDGGVVVVRDGGFPTTDSFDPTSVVNSFAAALCARQNRCNPYLADRGAPTATCEADTRTAISGTYQSIKTAIDQHRIGFRQADFTACIQAITNADCDLGVGLNSPCDRFLYGTLLQGSGCMFTDECSSGLYCQPTGNGFCGTCEPRAQSGDDCSQSECLESLDCFTIGDGQGGTQDICLPVAQENATCGDFDTGLCAGSMDCVGPDFQTDATGQNLVQCTNDQGCNAAGNYRCIAFGSNGSYCATGDSGSCKRPINTASTACDPDQGTTAGCNFARSLTCVPNQATPTTGTCQTIQWNATGGSCASNDPLAYCRYGNACLGNQNAETCQALPAVGSSCLQGACASGAYCDANNSCQAPKASGATCSPGECAPGLICNPASNTCTALTFTACGP